MQMYASLDTAGVSQCVQKKKKRNQMYSLTDRKETRQ